MPSPKSASQFTQAHDGQHVVHFHVGRSVHPLFQEQATIVPPGFRYCFDHPDLSVGAVPVVRRISAERAGLPRVREPAERWALRGLSWAGHVRRKRLTPCPDAEFIHSAQLLLRDLDRPYVVDFECVEVFSLYQRRALRRPWARTRLLEALAADECRFVLPWSDAARRGLATALGSAGAHQLEPKTFTLLPAIRVRAERTARRGRGPLRLLFIGTAFLEKGGVEAMRAVQRVRGSQDVTLDVVSSVPHRWRAEITGSTGVTLHPWPASSSAVRALLERSHALLFPSHIDTLGFVILEAMAHGMPVLAASHFAVPELVEHGASGLLFRAENPLYGPDGVCCFDRTLPPPRSFLSALSAPSDRLVEEIATALARVAGEPGLHDELAAGALARVREGPLSAARRREELAHVYRQTIA